MGIDEFKKTAVASASHDAKNLLFQAVSGLQGAESQVHKLLQQAAGQTITIEVGDLTALQSAIHQGRASIEAAVDKIQNALRLYASGHAQEHYFLPIQPTEIVLEAAANVGGLVDEKGLDLKVDVGGETGLVREEWLLPRDIVLEGLTNALQNAVRFAASTIVLNVLERGDVLVFEVHDDGPGYSVDSAPLVGGGSGAGLLITQNTLKQIGGQLTLGRSSVLGGALFSMEVSSHAA